MGKEKKEKRTEREITEKGRRRIGMRKRREGEDKQLKKNDRN